MRVLFVILFILLVFIGIVYVLPIMAGFFFLLTEFDIIGDITNNEYITQEYIQDSIILLAESSNADHEMIFDMSESSHAVEEPQNNNNNTQQNNVQQNNNEQSTNNQQQVDRNTAQLEQALEGHDRLNSTTDRPGSKSDKLPQTEFEKQPYLDKRPLPKSDSYPVWPEKK